MSNCFYACNSIVLQNTILICEIKNFIYKKRNKFNVSLITTALFIILTATPFAQGTWNWQNPLPQGNIIYDIHTFDATTAIFVGAAGTIYKTTDGGEDWYPQTSGTTNFLNSVDFIDASIGWAVGSSGTILNTTNGGTSWASQNSGTTLNLNSVSFIDANTGWAVGFFGLVIKTTNGGINWTAQTSGTPNSLESVDFVSANIGWASGYNGTILKTSDGGTNWVTQTSGTINPIFKVDFVNTSSGWAVGNYGTILKTTNGGTTWTAQTSGTVNHLYSVYFLDSNTGWAIGDVGTILKTTNGGANWISQTSGFTNALISLDFVNTNTCWAVGASGIILKTSNSGASWSSQSNGVIISLLSVDFVNANFGWAVGRSGTIMKTTNGGINWDAQTSGITNDLYSVHFVDVSIGWVVGDAGTILKTTNGGTSWVSQISGVTNPLNSIDFVNANTGWAVGGFGTTLKTTDGGTNWTNQPHGGDMRGAVDFIDINTGWVVGSSGMILKTTNGGTTWATQTSGTASLLTAAYFSDANIGWVVGTGGIILKTTDGGTNWVTQASGTTNGLYSVDFVDVNIGWAVSSGGEILNTINGGANWISQISGSSKSLFSVDFVDVNTGWVVGDGGTILQYTADPISAVQLISPNGGENFFVDEIKTITWIRNRVNSIKLEYTTNNGSSWNIIANFYPSNPDNFSWTIPPTPSTQCKIKISDALNPGTFDISNDLFTISFPVSDSIFVSVNELDAAAGDTVILNVGVQLPPNSSFISAEINFDGFGNNLQFLEIDTTETLAGRAKWIYYNNFQDSVLYTAFAGSDSITGSGVLFKLKFVVPANLGAGLIPINFNSAIFNTGSVFVRTSSGGVNIIAPHYGDVDLNDIVQAYDAATILQYLANMIALNQQQKLNADVTLDNTISAYDASVILQYVVHIIDTLPHTSVIIAAGELKMPDGAILPSGFVEVPLNLTNGNNIYSFEAEINFDSEILQYQSIEFSTALSGFVKQSNSVANSLIIVGASTSPGITAGNYAKIKFSLKPNVSAEDTKIILSKLRLNENAVAVNSDTALISTINNIPGDVSLPAEYSLAQNYPNPFNPSTTINYDLPEASHVTLKIFNVMGELVQVLTDEEKPAGYHHTDFNAAGLSSGIYFYRISAGSFTDIKKMILVK